MLCAGVEVAAPAGSPAVCLKKFSYGAFGTEAGKTISKRAWSYLWSRHVHLSNVHWNCLRLV